MIRVLFTGLGSIGRRHHRLLRESDFQVDCHAYRSGKSSRETPDGVTAHESIAEALSVDPDVAFVTNPTALHVETALECARADCDLFVEKPLSHSLEDTDVLVEECTERDLVTCVGCQLRFHPALQRVQTALEESTIGQVRSFRAYAGSSLPEWRPDQDYRESYSADPALGGGVVLDLIHEIDYSYCLFGDVEGVTSWTGQVSDLEIDSEDLAEIVLETKKGPVGEIHLDYYRPEPRRTLEVVGSTGVIRANLIADEVLITTDEGSTTETYDVDRDDLFRRQLDAFLTAVETGESCANDVREGKTVLEIALEARNS